MGNQKLTATCNVYIYIYLHYMTIYIVYMHENLVSNTVFFRSMSWIKGTDWPYHNVMIGSFSTDLVENSCYNTAWSVKACGVYKYGVNYMHYITRAVLQLIDRWVCVSCTSILQLPFAETVTFTSASDSSKSDMSWLGGCCKEVPSAPRSKTTYAEPKHKTKNRSETEPVLSLSKAYIWKQCYGLLLKPCLHKTLLWTNLLNKGCTVSTNTTSLTHNIR